MAKKTDDGIQYERAISRWENEGGSSRKRPTLHRDPNQRAKTILDMATANVPAKLKLTPVQEYARSGGLKGGKARAEKLTPQQRTEIARVAAQARLKKR